MPKCEVTRTSFVFGFRIGIDCEHRYAERSLPALPRLLRLHILIENKAPVGTDAIEGETYNIRGVILFRPTLYDREVTGKGDSIMVYDPNADMDSPPYWENDDPSKEEASLVPAGFEIRVIGAVVVFKRV